jgi:hypothetical protein
MKTDLEEFLGQRLFLVLRLREVEKKTFREIGSLLGVCFSQASNIYERAVRRRQDFEDGEKVNPYFGLSCRATNCCRNANLMNRAQIMAAIKEGSFHPKIKNSRNFGWKTYLEIHKWLGMPEPKRSDPWIRICSHCGNMVNILTLKSPNNHPTGALSASPISS